MNELSLIVDTNFFHECKEIETLNWVALGSFDSINVIVTSRVITELDNQKNSHKPRIKRRALKINKILANIIDNQLEPYIIQETAPRVLLKIENIAASRKYNNILDDRVTDDMIIATACALRDKYSEKQFCLLSGDLGVAAKALDSEIQLPLKRIPDEWKRDEEEDEEQKEIRRLKKEIATYKEREPDIQIFANDNDHERIDKIIISRDGYIGLSEHQLGNLQEYLKKKYPIVDIKYVVPNKDQYIYSDETYVNIINRYKEYEVNYKEYEVNYNDWVIYNMKYIRSLEKRLNTSFFWEGYISIVNQGKAIAEHIIIRLTANGNIKIAPYKNDINYLAIPPTLLNSYSYGYDENENLTVDDYTPRKIIEYKYDDLQHHVDTKKIFIQLFTNNIHQNLNASIEVKVFAANIPTAVIKTIPIQLQQNFSLVLEDKVKQMIDDIYKQIGTNRYILLRTNRYKLLGTNQHRLHGKLK